MFPSSVQLFKNSVLKTFAVDVSECDTQFVVRADLAGAKKDDISVEYSEPGNQLKIKAKIGESFTDDKSHKHCSEIRTGSMERVVSFGYQRIDAKKIEAHYKNGILTLKIPKASSNSTKIKVKL